MIRELCPPGYEGEKIPLYYVVDTRTNEEINFPEKKRISLYESAKRRANDENKRVGVEVFVLREATPKEINTWQELLTLNELM
jgi:hypothetical protein